METSGERPGAAQPKCDTQADVFDGGGDRVLTDQLQMPI